jgi:hypothetical protein
MQQLIRAMRLAFPEILLVQNRGLALIDELTDDIDALLVESAFSSYDFASGDYLEHPDDAVLGYLDMLADEELPLLTLDYAATAAEAFAIAEQARRAGYLPFVSTILLDDLPYDLSRDNGGRAETVRH